MIGRGVLGVLLIAWGTACAAPLGPSISHDEAQVFRADTFDWPRLKAGGLGLLGVGSTVAPEGIRDDVGFVLDQAASNYLSRLRLVLRSDAVARARQVGMEADMTRLVRGYETTSAIDAGLLRRMAAAQGVRYFLLTRIERYERTTREMSGPGSVVVARGPVQAKRPSERVQRVRLRADVWDSRCGTVVWTGEGGTEVVEETTSEDVRLLDVLNLAATNLVSLLPRPGDPSRAPEKECGT